LKRADHGLLRGAFRSTAGETYVRDCSEQCTSECSFHNGPRDGRGKAPTRNVIPRDVSVLDDDSHGDLGIAHRRERREPRERLALGIGLSSASLATDLDAGNLRIVSGAFVPPLRASLLQLLGVLRCHGLDNTCGS
jgi:hypothetical protein